MRRTRKVERANVTRVVAAHYDRMAQRYDRALDRLEHWLLGDWRAWAAAQAAGRTLEIGCGTGRTFPFYTPRATVVGVDASRGMLLRARCRAREACARIVLVQGDAQTLPARDGSVDVVVSVLSLCTIPDHVRALAEAWRVLRPGGRLVLLEHVRSPHRIVRLFQRLLDPLSVRFGHDHLVREPLDALKPLGFRVLRVERRALGIVERVLAEKPAQPWDP